MNDYGPGDGRCRERKAEGGGIASSYETWRRVGEADGGYQRRPSVVRASLCVLKQRGGMRRSGALALGAVLMLGGVTGGRGDELSGSVGMGDAPSSGGFMLPTLPENWADANWADMPFRLTASESVSYNNNIFALPAGESQP